MTVLEVRNELNRLMERYTWTKDEELYILDGLNLSLIDKIDIEYDINQMDSYNICIEI